MNIEVYVNQSDYRVDVNLMVAFKLALNYGKFLKTSSKNLAFNE